MNRHERRLLNYLAPGVEPMHHKDAARLVNNKYKEWIARREARGTLTTLPNAKHKAGSRGVR